MFYFGSPFISGVISIMFLDSNGIYPTQASTYYKTLKSYSNCEASSGKHSFVKEEKKLVKK